MKGKFRTICASFVITAQAWSTEDYKIDLIAFPQKIRQNQKGNAKQNLQMLIHCSTIHHAAD